MVIKHFNQKKEMQAVKQKVGKQTEKITVLKKKTIDREISIVDLVKKNYAKDSTIEEL